MFHFYLLKDKTDEHNNAPEAFLLTYSALLELAA